NNAYNPKEKGPLLARSISQTGAFNYTRFFFPLTIKEHPDRNHFFVDMILQFLFDLLHRTLLRWQWVIDKKIKGLCWIACFVKSEHESRDFDPGTIH
uniref:hypothetical protein n=1 Tax=uncultured Dubosiella sp. TaxID=1937011 RepID=UPI00261C4534